MKSIVMPNTVQLNEETKEKLSTEVKETAAKDVRVNNRTRKFTAADMWNHQRKSRSASAMMRKWNLN